jgi:hypothetical protein
MDDATWFRHANPWSVWTRASVLPLVILRDVVPVAPRHVYVGKLWLLDRMVWSYEGAIAQHERYRSWLD